MCTATRREKLLNTSFTELDLINRRSTTEKTESHKYDPSATRDRRRIRLINDNVAMGMQKAHLTGSNNVIDTGSPLLIKVLYLAHVICVKETDVRSKAYNSPITMVRSN